MSVHTKKPPSKCNSKPTSKVQKERSKNTLAGSRKTQASSRAKGRTRQKADHKLKSQLTSRKTIKKSSSEPTNVSKKTTRKTVAKRKAPTKKPAPKTRQKNKDADRFAGLVAPSTEQASNISKAIAEACQLEDTIEEITEILKTHKKDYMRLIDTVIPELCLGAGCKEFSTNSAKVQIKDIVAGSLPKDEIKRRDALTWIDKNGGGDLIKFAFKADVGKGQKRKLREAKAALKKLGIDAVSDITVHPQTLAAWVRERMTNGEATPLESLGIWTGQHAKIKRLDIK